MYKVIKSAVFENKPHVVKAPESLFIINSAQDEWPSDKNNELFSRGTEDSQNKKDDFQRELDEAQQKRKAIKIEIAELENELNDKQAELDDLRKKADLIMQDAQENKEKLLGEAKEEAAKKIEAANGKVEEITQAAKEGGHQQGYKEGLEQAKLEQKEKIKAANEKAVNIIDEAEKQINSYYKKAENDIVDIVMLVSQKIISQQVSNMPQLILPVVQAALKKVQDQASIEVRVPPDAYDLVLAAKSELQTMLKGNAKLAVKPDESLMPGDCWVETPDGSIDAKLLSQLNEIRKSLKEVVGKYEVDDQQV